MNGKMDEQMFGWRWTDRWTDEWIWVDHAYKVWRASSAWGISLTSSICKLF
jgi:hypothetical protein